MQCVCIEQSIECCISGYKDTHKEYYQVKLTSICRGHFVTVVRSDMSIYTQPAAGVQVCSDADLDAFLNHPLCQFCNQ